MITNTGKTDRFEYHLEDLDCSCCLHRISKSKRRNSKIDCEQSSCRYGDIRREAIAKGRICRPESWFAYMN